MKNNLFGTDGVRCAVGTGPLSAFQLPRLSHAIAQWITHRYSAPKKILIAHDTRASADWIATHLHSSLLLHGINVFYAHALPTPVVAALLHHTHQFECGIIISASHNPATDNGIKIIDAKSGKLSDKDETEIQQLYAQNIQSKIDYSHLGTLHYVFDAYEQYSHIIEPFFKPHFLKNIIIVLDCANGATSAFAPKLFQHYGASVIPINNQPNGKNINNQCGAVHPQQLQKAVAKHKAHIGFAFDGDGDRVIAVNKHGSIKNGDDILALLSTHHEYQKEKTIVGTIMSNHGFATFLEKQNKHLMRTAVGDKHVGHALQKNDLLLGGEQSGHIITRDYLPSGDGMFVALRVAQAMIETQNFEFETFAPFPQVLINVPIVYKADLNQAPFAQLIKHHETQLENGRLIVRYSGTENVLRVMVEDSNEHYAQEIGAALARILHNELN